MLLMNSFSGMFLSEIILSSFSNYQRMVHFIMVKTVHQLIWRNWMLNQKRNFFGLMKWNQIWISSFQANLKIKFWELLQLWSILHRLAVPRANILEMVSIEAFIFYFFKYFDRWFFSIFVFNELSFWWSRSRMLLFIWTVWNYIYFIFSIGCLNILTAFSNIMILLIQLLDANILCSIKIISATLNSIKHRLIPLNKLYNGRVKLFSHLVHLFIR